MRRANFPVMPLYYFYLESDKPVAAEEPEELPDDQAARLHAEQVARELSLAANTAGCVVVLNERREQVHRAYLLPHHRPQ